MRRLKFDIYDVILWFMYLCFAVMLIVAGYFAVRIYIVDQFIIPTGSMQPTLIPGDRVIVNKLIAGARIYDEYDFREGVPMKSHRLKGQRVVRHNDIVIFNFPINYQKKKIEFEINYVYGKRCIGMPGDSVSIVNGFYRNNNYDGIIGVAEQQQRLSNMPDSIIPKPIMRVLSLNGITPRWTVKEFGPLYVPKQGDEIAITRSNLNIYRRIIEFETNKKITIRNRVIMLGEDVIERYHFTKNYYFLCGDNILDSSDSRYWGFVPEEFIVGVVSRITYSRDRETNKFRWDRFMKSVMK